MASFTFYGLRQLWIQNGGSEASADTAAAIALAESSGCQYALAGPVDVRPVKQCVYRHTTGENSFGLWQINLQAHPELDAQSLFDANYNAAAAVRISSHGSDFTPWTTFTSGAWTTYLPADRLRQHTPHVTIRARTADTDPSTLEPTNALTAWKRLMRAIGSTMPTQAHEARIARRHFMQAIR